MTNVKDIMAKNVACANPNASLVEIAKLMIDFDCGEIPLVENEANKRVVGVITDRDIVCRSLGQGNDPMKLTARDCMTSPAVTVTLDMTTEDCVEIMEEYKIRRIPVVDDNDILCGMIALADLIMEVDEEVAAEMVQEVSTPPNNSPQVHH